jgi:OFA family oxalate/formate antiporter-like MFS transporter
VATTAESGEVVAVEPTVSPAVAGGAVSGEPWRPVLAGVLANLAVGTLFGWSLVAAPAVADVGASAGTASAVFAAAIGVFTVALLGVGRALRRLGPGRLLGVAAAGAGAGLGTAASWDRPLALWAGVALLFGAAGGLAYGVSMGLTARVSGARRGAATGLVVAAYAAGPVLLGLVAPHAVPFFGWRACLAVLAVIVMGLLVGAAALAPADPRARSAPSGAEGPVGLRSVVPLWVVFAGGAAPGLVVFASAAPLAAGRGLGPAAAGAAVSMLAAGNLGGRLLSGWWSDRVGRRTALGTALAVAAASVGGLAGPTETWAVLSAFVGTGLAYGAVSALVPAATVDRVGPRAFSRAYGRVFTAWGCAGLAAPVVGGALTGAGGQRAELVLVAAVPLIPAALALPLLTPRARERGCDDALRAPRRGARS